MDYIQINCYERDAQTYFEGLVKTLTAKIDRMEKEHWHELNMQWARIGFTRSERLLFEARLSLSRIRSMDNLEAIKVEAERGFQASTEPKFATPPYDVIPYQEQVMLNYRALLAAFTESAERGYAELTKQRAWLVQEGDKARKE